MKKVILLVLFLGLTVTGLIPNATWAKMKSFDVDHWLAELESRTKGEASKKVTTTKAKEKAISPFDKLSGTSGKEAPEKEAKHISVDFYKMDLHNVFRLLGEISGKNIVVDESVSGTVTLALKDVPWTFVLDVIKSLKGLSSIEKFNTIMIFPSGKKVAWGAGEEEANKGALEVKKSPELIIPEIKKGSDLVVKKGYSLKTSLEAVEKARSLLSKAKEKEASGNIKAALALYKEAAKLWPDNEDLLKRIATLSLGKAREELQAFNYAKMALQIDPKDSEAASIAAVALARMGRNDEAINYFERAVSSPDASYETLYNYAVFLYANARYRDAIRILNRIEARYPITPESILLKARSFEALGEEDKAAAQYVTVVNGGEEIPPNMKAFARSKLKELTERTDKKRE